MPPSHLYIASMSIYVQKVNDERVSSFIYRCTNTQGKVTWPACDRFEPVMTQLICAVNLRYATAYRVHMHSFSHEVQVRVGRQYSQRGPYFHGKTNRFHHCHLIERVCMASLTHLNGTRGASYQSGERTHLTCMILRHLITCWSSYSSDSVCTAVYEALDKSVIQHTVESAVRVCHSVPDRSQEGTSCSGANRRQSETEVRVRETELPVLLKLWNKRRHDNKRLCISRDREADIKVAKKSLLPHSYICTHTWGYIYHRVSFMCLGAHSNYCMGRAWALLSRHTGQAFTPSL